MGKVVDLFRNQKNGFPSQLVTKEDLQTCKEEILTTIRSLLQTKGPSPNKKWLKSYEVKKLLGISTGTLQTLRSRGELPFTKMGGIMYYDPTDIDSLLQEKKRLGLTTVPMGSNHLNFQKNRHGTTISLPSRQSAKNRRR